MAMVEVRSQCLKRLVKVLEDAKEYYTEAFSSGEYDMNGFLEYLLEHNAVLDYERIARELGVSVRTAYDYTETIRKIAWILRGNCEE